MLQGQLVRLISWQVERKGGEMEEEEGTPENKPSSSFWHKVKAE